MACYSKLTDSGDGGEVEDHGDGANSNLNADGVI